MSVLKLDFIDGQLYDQNNNLVKLPEGKPSMLIADIMFIFDTEQDQNKFSAKLSQTINEVVAEQAEEIAYYRPQ